jgi:hypothetical protein
MRYRSFGDRLGAVSALTVRLDDSRRKGSAVDWRDFVFAAMEAGINSFEIGAPSPALLAGVAEAFGAMERRLFAIGWRTSLVGGAHAASQRARELLDALGLDLFDLLTLDLEGHHRSPTAIADIRDSGVARLVGAAGSPALLDEALLGGEFDCLVMQMDPDGNWNERNRIRTASQRGMGVIIVDAGLELNPTTSPSPKRGLLQLLTGRAKPQLAANFEVAVPGWNGQQIAVVHALSDPCVSTVVVQPDCTSSMENLAWCVERDLPAGAQAQIEMARFSGPPPPIERRRLPR